MFSPLIRAGDAALRWMARQYPQDSTAFLLITGVGERKLADYGDAFLKEIAGHVATYGRQPFAALPTSLTSPPTVSVPAAATAAKSRGERLTGTVQESVRRFQAGESAEQIAQARGFTLSTILGHLATGADAGLPLELSSCLTAQQSAAIAEAVEQCGAHSGLKPIWEHLGGTLDYGQIRIWFKLRTAAG